MSYLSGYRLPRFLGLVLPSSAAPSRPRPREGNGELAPKSGHDMLDSIGNFEVWPKVWKTMKKCGFMIFTHQT